MAGMMGGMYCRDCHYCLYRLGDLSVCPECGRGGELYGFFVLV